MAGVGGGAAAGAAAGAAGVGGGTAGVGGGAAAGMVGASDEGRSSGIGSKSGRAVLAYTNCKQMVVGSTLVSPLRAWLKIGSCSPVYVDYASARHYFWDVMAKFAGQAEGTSNEVGYALTHIW